MTYVITSRCAGTCDTVCASVCPADCIDGPIPLATLRTIPAAERDQRYPGLQLFINPEECIDCGACLDECPVGAIHQEDDVPSEHRTDIATNARFFAERRAHA
jgi:NAD-dependent dihydropyrimidine dehydrogenase PreA subunit